MQAIARPGPGVEPDSIRRLPVHWRWLVLGAIVLLAFAVRIVDITDNPPGFFTDEAAAGLDAQAIWTTSKDMHGQTLPVFFESLGDYKLPVYIYTLVPFVGVLGLSEFSVRLPVALFGALSVVTTYLLAREVMSPLVDSARGTRLGVEARSPRPSGESVSERGGPSPEPDAGATWLANWRQELPALATAALLAVLPWHVHYSRTGFGEMVSFPLVFALAWWLFLRAHRKGASLLPAALAFGLCFYTYRSAWVAVPPFLVLLVLLYARDLLARPRESMKAGGLLLASLIPLAYHLLLGPDDRAATSWIFNIDSEQSTLSLFIEQYRSYFTTAFLFEDGDNGPILRHYLPGHGVLYWFMLPMVLAGVVQVLLHRQRAGLLVLALVLLYPLAAALSDTSPISSRAILGSIVFVLLAGFGVQLMIDLVRYVRPARLVPGAIAATAAVVMVAGSVSVASYLDRYFDEYPLESEGFWGWQGGPKTIIDRFVELQGEYDELYLEGYFNAPRVFIPFYAGDSCPKCRIGATNRYDPDLRQLFALRVESDELDRAEVRIVDTYFYRNGEPGFVFVEILRLRDGP